MLKRLVEALQAEVHALRLEKEQDLWQVLRRHSRSWPAHQIPGGKKRLRVGAAQFYVNVGEKSAFVIIALSTRGHKYLKTEADSEHPNNLLSLPECT
jgi:hypothetical protein